MLSNAYGDLERCEANYAPLTPVSFLTRAAAVYPEKTAVIDGERRFSYRQFDERCRRLASALINRGIQQGDTVAIIAPNVVGMLEAHYGVPMAGAVLNALNTRMDAATLGFCLRHGNAKIVLVDSEYLALIRQARAAVGLSVPLVVIGHEAAPFDDEEEEYEAFLQKAEPIASLDRITDEWSPISLGYTSGTTGDPKGVVCHHRGAYLNTLGNVLAAHLDDQSVYLWTLPMFHCNGWSHTWAVTAIGGTHVCLRKIDPQAIYAIIRREAVTHLSAAPIVLNMLAEAANEESRFDHSVRILTGGSAPPTSVMSAVEKLGFLVMHIYGLTETTGPSLICEWQGDWNTLSYDTQMTNKARQGVRLITMQEAIVADPASGLEVEANGKDIGEILLRGNTVMMGYLKNEKATGEAFAGGWFHTGDLAVRHPDGYIEIKDRAKDVIISGGENISSVEIEEILFRHPAVREAAVVARPDSKWGEHPCAFIDIKEGADTVSESDLIEFCRSNLARFKIPKTFIFGPLPKTSTGKVQKHLLRARARNIVAQ
ncbi:MAG: AMP-binding protein [Pseudaminobacter sp.]